MARKQSGWRSDDEWFDIITRCRQSGLSDGKWCSVNGIPHSSFYTASKRLQEKAYAIPEPIINDVNPLDFTSKQEVVKIDIKQDISPVNYDETEVSAHAVPVSSSYLDNSHTIEIQMGATVIRVSNDADPNLVKLITTSLIGGNSYAC